MEEEEEEEEKKRKRRKNTIKQKQIDSLSALLLNRRNTLETPAILIFVVFENSHGEKAKEFQSRSFCLRPASPPQPHSSPSALNTTVSFCQVTQEKTQMRAKVALGVQQIKKK
ncbi:hypothetical protein E2C01_028568 [Portunus trituberculatus]|uniref:Uncharacterized protein n=1 Tax=Portunus trituberculatus TaxID=210409 RepID=A0A5B7EL04_PORTR|nr:hypothetical protein [Portunus trituberculatus]